MQINNIEPFPSKLISREVFEWYKKEVDSFILSDFKKHEDAFNSVFESHKWHLENSQKRMIYFFMYGLLLLKDSPRSKILDVGGGITSFTTLLSKIHDYSLIDIINVVDPIRNINGLNFIHSDWYNYNIKEESWDVIIANDIFPNVDQRLELFLDKYLPYCKQINLSLTYHNDPKWYETKRVDGIETLFMLAWTGKQLLSILKKYSDRIIYEKDRELFYVEMLGNTESIFSNKRQVCIICLKGDLT